MRNSFKSIYRFLLSDCNDSERRKFLKRISEDKDFAKRINLLKRLLNVKFEHSLDIDTDLMWAKMLEHIRENEKGKQAIPYRNRYRKHLLFFPKCRFVHPAIAYLFIAVLILSVSVYFLRDHIDFRTQQKTTVEYKTIKVDYGKRLSFQLSDGSKIIADAGSEMRLPVNFKECRDVRLKGEAFFDVTYDPDHPFYVHANHALVKVLGTKFNIRAWDENPVVFVVVSQGKVTLQRDDDLSQNVVTLAKGKISILDPYGQPTIPVDVDVEQHLKWMNNEMHFKIVKLKEIFGQLERWFNIKFVIDNPVLLEKKLSVHIKENNLDEVLNVISILTNTTMKKTGNIVEVTEK